METTEVIYIYERMDSHLFQVVRSTGQVIDEVDIITAEGTANRLSKRGFRVQWIDRSPSKERKYVRNLISKFLVSDDTHYSYHPVRAGV